MSDVERLLRRALAPVDPPEQLVARVRSRLLAIRDEAAEELESWELAAMRDPRNWARPAIAVLAGAAAGAGLLVIGRQERSRALLRRVVRRR
ncbi:MAG TPA: hypothetical protein VID68_03375 [Solirubrobacteraceae bacterium]